VVFNTYCSNSSIKFCEGILKAWDNDKTKYIDTNGKVIANVTGYNNEDFSEGFAFVNGFYIDKTGELRLDLLASKSIGESNFYEGLAKVEGYDKKIGFMDKKGKIVIPIQYKAIEVFQEGLAAYRDNSGWGFIDKTGKIIIEPQFQKVHDGFKNGVCKVIKNNQWGYINKKGEFIWKEQNDIQYTKIDLSKWKLDTLETNKPFYVPKYSGSKNIPRQKKYPYLNAIILKVDTSDLTVFEDKYFGLKLYLINASKNTIKISAQDNRIKIIQQAKNKKGEWQDIEYHIDSFCSHSYHTLKFLPNEYQIFPIPIFKGAFKTQIRFKLLFQKQEIYSNIYAGYINYAQLTEHKNDVHYH
jgi:hypothetical protein